VPTADILLVANKDYIVVKPEFVKLKLLLDNNAILQSLICVLLERNVLVPLEAKLALLMRALVNLAPIISV